MHDSGRNASTQPGGGPGTRTSPNGVHLQECLRSWARLLPPGRCPGRASAASAPSCPLVVNVRFRTQYAAGRPRNAHIAQLSDARIPDSRSPASRFGRETGPGEGIPVSRFGQNRDSGNPRFPIRPGTGNGASIWPKIGKSGILIPCEYQTRSLGQMLPFQDPRNVDFWPPPRFSKLAGKSESVEAAEWRMMLATRRWCSMRRTMRTQLHSEMRPI